MRHNSYGLDLYIYFVSTHNNVLRVLRHQEIRCAGFEPGTAASALHISEHIIITRSGGQ